MKETITVEQIVSRKKKDGSPFRIVNDRYFVWDEDVFRDLVEGHTYECDVQPPREEGKNPTIKAVTEKETAEAVEHARQRETHKSRDDTNRQMSIEQQSALHDFVRLEAAKQAEQFFGEHYALVKQNAATVLARRICCDPELKYPEVGGHLKEAAKEHGAVEKRISNLGELRAKLKELGFEEESDQKRACALQEDEPWSNLKGQYQETYDRLVNQQEP